MVHQFVITKRLNGTKESLQSFQGNTRVLFFVRLRVQFRERWLRKKNFASYGMHRREVTQK